MSFLQPAMTKGQKASEQQSFTRLGMKSEKKERSKRNTNGVQTSTLFSPDDRKTRDILEERFECRKNVLNTGRPTSLKLLPAVISEARKDSTDTSNTDRLMRFSPTGIPMRKPEAVRPRTAENLPRKGVKSNSDEKNTAVVVAKTALNMDQNDLSKKDLYTPKLKNTARGNSKFTTNLETPNVNNDPNRQGCSRNLHTGNRKLRARQFSCQVLHPVPGIPSDDVTPSVYTSTKSMRALNIGTSQRLGAGEELQRVKEEVDSNDAHTNNRYLDGKVSKTELMSQNRMKLLNNVRLIAFKGRRSKRTESNDNHTMKEHFHRPYPAKTDLRNMSLPRLGFERTPYGDLALGEQKRTSHERGSYRVRNPRNLGPAKLYSVSINGDHKSRSRTKSAPDLKTDLMGTSSPGRRREYRGSLRRRTPVTRKHADYANRRNYGACDRSNEGKRFVAEYTNERKTSLVGTPGASNANDNMDSADTEALVISPPMPLFDASPSLTTESEEHSVISQDSENTSIENLALKSSFLANEHKSSTENSDLKLSKSPRETASEQEWQEKKRKSQGLSMKPGIINSFLEDCLRRSHENVPDAQPTNGKLIQPLTMQEDVVLSEGNGSEKSVETLRKMLFSAQRLSYSSEENLDRGINDRHSFQTQSESLTEEILSDILLTANENEGHDSLSKAYYHLARLKRLVSASKEVAAWK